LFDFSGHAAQAAVMPLKQRPKRSDTFCLRERFLLKHSSMATTLGSLRAKLAECKSRLEEAKGRSAAIFNAASAVHRRSLVDLLQRCPLSPQDFINGAAAEMMDLVMNSNLSEADMELIFVHLTPPKSKEHPKKGGKMSQNFINFHLYMPEWLQKHFATFTQNQNLDGALTAAQLQDHLFDFLSNLGMRRGDEFTYKRMNSFMLVHTEQADKRQMLTAKCKFVLKNNLRTNWLRRQNDQHQPSFCEELPTDTAAFLIEHPELYKAALKDSSPPRTCLLKMPEVLEFESTYSCRNAGWPHHTQVWIPKMNCNLNDPWFTPSLQKM
jgi:hypothetical protein